MFIQTIETPNPLTLKFIPGKPIMQEGTLDIPSASQAAVSPLAESLFHIQGIQGLFFGQDFISVTKEPAGEWAVLKPQILGTIMEYFMTHDSVIVHGPSASSLESSQEESDIVAEIRDLIETRIRPAVAQDGGDIIFDHFKEGIVYLKLQGACSGCPSSTVTLKNGIESMLRHYIPEVQEVRAL